LTPLDWLILLIMYAVIMGSMILTRRHMRGVADYLAAGRSAGRYLLTVSAGIAAVGAITIVANLEMGYEAGFAMGWWGLSMSLFMTIVTVTGWVNYRFRRTRALTLSEFFERRYSRGFRIFAGSVAFGAGLINFGIFPAVEARFFIHYLGLPEVWQLGPLGIPLYPAIMLITLGSAVWFVLSGGHVSVLVTDFIQGVFAYVVFLVLAAWLLRQVGWDDVSTVMRQSPPGLSKINPFDTGYVTDFNVTYFLIGVIGLFYGAMSWQGTQAYNTSARSAHEGKMGNVLGLWRGIGQGMFMTFVPILIYTVLHHPDWSGLAGGVQAKLDVIPNEAVRSQMRGPLTLAALLPTGLLGAFAALMLCASISTLNTYMHSWSSIFVQDVLIPLRRAPLSPTVHLRTLRLAVIGVALFAFVFSLFYKQSQAILLFFALTGAIFAGWSGAVIIGGLYTKWGTTGGAWAAGISGVTLTMTGFVLEQAKRAWHETGTPFWGLLDFAGPARTHAWVAWIDTSLPNGQQIWGWSMWVCAVVYVAVSLIQQAMRKRTFDLDRLLHRGRFAVAGEFEGTGQVVPRGWRAIGITDEFGKRDKVLYVMTWSWNLLWMAVFAVGTLFFLSRRLTAGGWSGYDTQWLRFWHTRFWIEIVVSSLVMVWFTIGGVRDVKRMLRDLNARTRDDTDDGYVHETDQRH
jgi:SSS family solute:Na+ symporter